MPDRLVFETREALDQDLANAIVAQLESGIETRGTATLCATCHTKGGGDATQLL